MSILSCQFHSVTAWCHPIASLFSQNCPKKGLKIESCEGWHWQACPGEVFHCAPVSSRPTAQTDQLTTAEEKPKIWEDQKLIVQIFSFPSWKNIFHSIFSSTCILYEMGYCGGKQFRGIHSMWAMWALWGTLLAVNVCYCLETEIQTNNSRGIFYFSLQFFATFF